MLDRAPQRRDDSIDILLVEDNPGDARLLQEAFMQAESEMAFYRVTTGEKALDFLMQQGKYESASLPEIVLLDLNLPGKNGYEVLDEIREDPRLQSLPVIILTSSKASEDIVHCYNAHANAYLTKPRNHDELVSIVEGIERFWFERVRFPPIPQ